jgi:phage tail-like protein
MPALSPTTMLGLSMRFTVEIDGLDLGGWAQCQGLMITFDGDQVEEGGNNDYLLFLPKRTKYEKITLSRAMNKVDSAKVMQWLQQKVQTEEKGTAQITLHDAHAEVVSSWSLRGVYPLKWSGPQLSADGKAVAVETLELFHEGFL